MNKMKKIIYLFAVVGLIFASACNPMEDINSEIDAQKNPIVGDAELTLTDEDYSALDLSYGSFSSLEDAKTILPPYLSDKYPVWGKGSAVLVGYKLYVGYAPGVYDYTSADDYRLVNADYPQGAAGATGFYPSDDASDFLADILAANVSDPVEGQNLLVKYKQYTEVPVEGTSNFFEENFNGSLGDFTTVNNAGTKDWYSSSYGSDEYAKISAYGNGPNEDWLISPEIDLAGLENIKFQVNQTAKYVNDRWDLLSVLISKDYTDDVATATWDNIELTTLPAGDDYVFVASENYDLSAYEGETVHIAFKYESNDDVAATWEINDVFVKTLGVEGNTINKEVFYTYSGGKWEASKGVYFLSDADFDSMGEEYGQPGYYNNFGSSISPDDYLSTFLTIKYPYAAEEDEIILVYDYYSSSSGAQLRGNVFTVTEGAWTGFASTISTTLQFAHDGNTWVPDNTIKYTLVKADYDYIVSSLASKYPSETANMGSYGNFNGYSWDADMILEAVNNVLLKNNPSAAEGQKFSVTYSIYDGSTHDDTIYVILQGGTYVLQ